MARTLDEYEQRRQEEQVAGIRLIKKIGKGVAAVAVVGVLLSGIYTVDQGERAAHTRMGALVDIVGPGMHFKTPIIEGARKFNVRNQTLKWQNGGRDNDSRLQAYSADQQPADIAITVTWYPKNDDKSVAQIFSQYGTVDAMEQAIIVPSVQEGFKNKFGKFTAVTAIQDREGLNLRVAEEVRELTRQYPVVIQSVQIQDVSFSDAYENAVEARMTAQVEVERKTQEKITEQLRADMTVIKAEAAAKATTLQGQADANAIRAKADALASNARLVELTAAERWNGVLPETMVPGGGVPMLNLGNK